MIFFEGYQQQYRVEELSSQQAARILTRQLLRQKETKTSADAIINRTNSFTTNLGVKSV